jgi:hypothetical protein
MIEREIMTKKKIKKWNDIVNPGLERSKNKSKDPFEEELEKAFGLDEYDSESKEDVWAKVDKSEVTPTPDEPVKIVDKIPIDEKKVRSVYSDRSKSHEPEGMTDSEREAYRKKRKKIENVMNEFVSWKESL